MLVSSDEYSKTLDAEIASPSGQYSTTVPRPATRLYYFIFLRPLYEVAMKGTQIFNHLSVKLKIGGIFLLSIEKALNPGGFSFR